MTGILERWGAFVVRHRWWILGCWLALVVAAGIYYPSVNARLAAPDYTVQNSESAAAQRMLAQNFPGAGTERALVVFRSAGLTADSAAYRGVVQRVMAVLPPGTVDPYAGPGQIGAAGHVAIAVVPLSGTGSQRADRAASLQTEVQDATRGGPVEAYLTGASALTNDLSDLELRDQSTAENIGVPVALAALLLALGAVVAALLTLLVAVGGVLMCTAVLGLLAVPLGLDRFVTVVATVIGIGVGIDYALFVISRFREELARRTPADAVVTTMRTSGRTVLTAGLIVMVALGSMVLVNSHIFREIALAAGLMIAFCLLTSLIALPAMLGMLGDRVTRGALPTRQPNRATPGPWARWGRLVQRHPYRFGVPALLLLIVLAVPMTSIKLGVDWGLAALGDTPSGKGQRIVASAFSPGAVSPVEVVACGTGDAAATGADRLARAVHTDPRVASVQPVERTGGCAAVRTTLSHPVDSPQASAFVRDLRDSWAPAAFAGTGVRPYVGGLSAEYVDVADETTGKLPLVVAVILLLSFGYLLVMFRSVLVPVKAVLLNLAATCAALGTATVIFQYGHGSSVLGFTSVGTLQAYLPIALFALLFGLSMDYEVFLVGRIQEERLRLGNDHAAIPSALDHTARQITAAASIMVIVFGSLLFARVLELKQFGFGLAFAVLLDATVVRLLLVPAVMSVADRANWWLPGFLARRLPAIEP